MTEKDMNEHQKFIKSTIDHIANGGKMVFDRRTRGKVMSLEQRLEVQITDRVEQQVQHCLREYENDLLEEKLIQLVKQWFFDGFKGGIDYERRQHEQSGQSRKGDSDRF